MSEIVRKRLAITFVAGSSLLLVVSVVVVWRIAGPGSETPVFSAFVAIPYLAAGALLAERHPRNAIGWILIVIGVGQAALIVGAAYTVYALWHVTDPRPLGAVVAWTGNWAYLLSTGPLVTLLFLLFPDGRPPTPRWRWVGWTALIGIAVAVVGTAAATWPARDRILLDPADCCSPEGPWGSVAAVGFALTFAVAGIASITSLLVRWRRSSGEVREQLRWFLAAASVTCVGIVLAFTPLDPGYVVLFLGMALMPIAVAVAVLKYHLYDIDIVIRKTVVFAVVAFALTALYLALVAVATLGGISRAIAGVVLLVVTFRPVRSAARSLADRITYGKRASAYEVLATFSERVSETYASDDVLPRMTQVLANATGATSARIWLRVGDELRPAADVGDPPRERPRAIVDDAMPDGLAGHVTEVRHLGELLGALAVVMPPNDPLDPGRERLMHDLAAQAGLVLRNARLIEELRASRQRLVAAQDEERRRLERNIHDGAQQQLVALAVQLRLLEGTVDRDPATAKTMAADLQAATNAALEDLRDLARGIYPPLLADRGLAAALQAQARKAAVPTRVDADGVGRYAPETEATVYFCVLEALNNVAKYARADAATVSLVASNGDLRFSVTDDGVGFDPAATGYGTGLQGMSDRLDAVGGRLEIHSEPGGGTTVTGSVAVEPREGSP